MTQQAGEVKTKLLWKQEHLSPLPIPTGEPASDVLGMIWRKNESYLDIGNLSLFDGWVTCYWDTLIWAGSAIYMLTDVICLVLHVRISSNIPGLIGALGEHHEAASIVTTSPVRGKQLEMDTLQMRFSCNTLPDFVVRQELSQAGLEIYVKKPAIPRPSAWQSSLAKPRVISMGWAVRIQLIVEGSDQRAWHFPAPT